MTTDSIQFLSGQSVRWGLVADFLEDRNGTIDCYGQFTAVDWKHSAIVQPDVAAMLNEKFSGVDYACDCLNLSGRERRIAHRLNFQKLRMLRASYLFESCREFQTTRKLPSDLTEEELLFCIEILRDAPLHDTCACGKTKRSCNELCQSCATRVGQQARRKRERNQKANEQREEARIQRLWGNMPEEQPKPQPPDYYSDD